jgi:dihydrofolate reductase
MGLPRRIEGYAIVSREGMICTVDGVMPDGLKIDADQRFFHGGLDRADAVANGRHSNEGGPHAAERPRLVLTRHIPSLAPDPTNPKAVLWNPAGARFEDAWDALKVDGTLAVVGGTDVFGLFLAIGYDVFFLSHASVSVPNGRPVFPGIPAQTPEAVLAGRGMVKQSERVLDERAQVTMAQWGRP